MATKLYVLSSQKPFQCESQNITARSTTLINKSINEQINITSIDLVQNEGCCTVLKTQCCSSIIFKISTVIKKHT